MGGNPKASFYINFEFGAYSGSFKGKDAPLVSASANKGTHGYFQTGGNMRSSLMVMGKGVNPGKNLGEIDMRAIAPMLASQLGVSLIPNK